MSASSVSLMLRVTVATPRAAAGMKQRVDHGTIVGAVAGGLHNHIACKAKVVAQREQLMFGRIARRIFAFRRVGKSGGRPEDVTMRVDRTLRRRETRLGRVGTPIEPARRLLELRSVGHPARGRPFACPEWHVDTGIFPDPR
jgi:hypothetical protein